VLFNSSCFKVACTFSLSVHVTEFSPVSDLYFASIFCICKQKLHRRNLFQPNTWSNSHVGVIIVSMDVQTVAACTSQLASGTRKPACNVVHETKPSREKKSPKIYLSFSGRRGTARHEMPIYYLKRFCASLSKKRY